MFVNVYVCVRARVYVCVCVHVSVCVCVRGCVYNWGERVIESNAEVLETGIITRCWQSAHKPGISFKRVE